MEFLSSRKVKGIVSELEKPHEVFSLRAVRKCNVNFRLVRNLIQATSAPVLHTSLCPFLGFSAFVAISFTKI